MSHILGLFDSNLSPEQIETVVGRMSENTHRFSPSLQAGAPVRLEHAALALAQRRPPAVYCANGVLAAICGRPTWSDPELQAIQRTEGASRALADAYLRYGDELPRQLNGPFALALIEPAKRRALLAVDRLGIEALAWRRLDGGLVFASRVDVLAAHPKTRNTPDNQALYDYFYFSMVPSPRTILPECHKLLPAQRLVYEDGQIDLDFYWHAPYSEPSGADVRELGAELKTRLDRAVERHIDPDPTGAFLSGGLDSSTVTGCFSRHGDPAVDVFGIGFDAEGYDEMAYARATARHFGARLHEYYVSPGDVADALPHIAAAYDEPFGNESAIPAYYCAKAAAADGKRVLLAGDGGDEIFAGNARYAKQKVFALYHRLPGPIRSKVLEPLVSGIPGVDKLPLLGKLNRYITYANMAMPDRLENYNFLHRTNPDDIFSPDFLTDVDIEEPLHNIREVYERAQSPEMLKRMLHMDLKITLADNDLRKVNRTSELAGIEVRYPMLDEQLVEFAARVPSQLLLKGFKLRHFYRNALQDFLAPETLAKRKQGFGLPFGLWLSTDARLMELAEERFKSFRSRGILRNEYFENLLQQHRSGHANYYGVMIWRIIMLEEWLSAHGY